MVDRFTLLRRKEVINICDGCRLGYVGDVEICIPEGSVKGIVVFGPCRFFGLFGRGEDFYIPWDCIQRFVGRGGTVQAAPGQNAVSRFQFEGRFRIVLSRKVHGHNAYTAAEVLRSA